MEYQKYNFERLEVYKLAEELVIKVYNLLKSFPKEELFGLTSQTKRAVVSVALNIAEGATAGTKKEFARFLNISTASLVETKSALMIAVKLQIIKQDDLNKLIPDFDKLFFKLIALKKSLYEE